ncbi:MAG: aminopeptidase P N-terminal domain-containing protein [Gemmatimonadota bacterium]
MQEAPITRRQKILEALGDGVMVLPSAPVPHRSRDTEYRYHPDAELAYATGITAPDHLAVFVGGEEARLVVFAPPRDPEAELWSGAVPELEEVREATGADVVYSIREADARLPDLLGRTRTLHVRLGRDARMDRWVLEALARARLRGARRGTGPRTVRDPGEILDEMRIIKDADEIEAIRRAVALTVRGHTAAREAVGAGAGEWEVEAAFLYAVHMEGGADDAFPVIVGSGPNACVLHYEANDRRMEKGDVVLIDAGAEMALYCGDVTRTYPVGDAFTPLQQEVYAIVEAAHGAAIEAALPGASVKDVHDAAVRVVVRGLMELGILQGGEEELTAREAYKPFFPHQTSHWLGMDVHDPGDYARDGKGRVLAPGMVLTVEPGLYFRPGMVEARPELEGIGIRIEDDLLITPEGHEVLSAGLPLQGGEAMDGEGREP